jgi:hypothetical protein
MSFTFNTNCNSKVTPKSSIERNKGADIRWSDEVERNLEVQRVMMEPESGAHHLFARLLLQLQIRRPYPAMFEQACAV